MIIDTESIKKNIGRIFIGVIFVALFLLGRSCGKTTIVVPKTENSVKIVSIKHHTVIVRDTITKIQFRNNHPISYTIVQYVPVKDTTSIKQLEAIRAYQDSIRDENIIIYSKDTVMGYLRSQKLSYRLFVPKTIIDSVTIQRDSIINNTIYPKWQLGAGVSVTPKNLFIDVDLTIKRITYSAGYDPFNKIPKIGIKFNIFKSKK